MLDSLGEIGSATSFFKDVRSRTATAPLTTGSAAALLRRFFERLSYESCGPGQLLALADLAVRAQDLDVACQALQRVLKNPERSHLANYRFGRLDLSAGRAEAASGRFARCIETAPDFAFGWVGMACALHAQGRRAEAARHAERFAEFGVCPQVRDDLAVLADLADMLFEAGDRERASPIYGIVHNFAAPNARVAVRRAEALMAEGHLQQALEVLRTAQGGVGLDPWGRRALAQCESLAGNHQLAVSIAEAALAERPSDAGFIGTCLEVLVRCQDPVAWRGALARMGTILPAENLRELEARVALVGGDLDQAASILSAVELRPATRLFWLAVEAAYAAISATRIDLASALSQRLLLVDGDKLAAVLLQASLFMHQQQWDDVAAALRRLPADQGLRPDVKLKWFELACFTDDHDQASQLKAELEQAGPLPRDAMPPVLRFLAERHQWSELVDRALVWLGPDFRYDQIGYVLFRAARRTSTHAGFSAAIEAVPGWRGNTDLCRLHTALLWDRAATPADIDVLAACATASRGKQHRMAVQRRVMARASLPPGRRALFLCTNDAYLCATIVAMHSALEHSAPGREDVFVVLDDTATERAERAVQPFRDRGFSVTVVPASDIVDAGEKLDAAYGLFTSGHVLASAAYYRIYFARHLHVLGGYSRALYLDSDVLVRSSLDALFTLDMGGQPMAARLETPRPEVRRAVDLHQLEDGTYFNSGVLLFDMASPRLGQALDDTVSAIDDDEVKLLFHDQCALNLGFRGCVHRLPTEWNAPVAEGDRPGDLSPGTAVLHYLDRPKPWSPAYEGPCADLWFDQWARTAELIGPAVALELLALGGD